MVRETFWVVCPRSQFVPEDQTSVALCLGMFGTGSVLCGLVSLLWFFSFFFLLKCCLITEHHNNSKTLPRGHLGRNCNISDHFREGRLGAGGVRRGLNSLEKMPWLFTYQLYQTSCIPCLLTFSISSATHCFPFLTFHFDSTAHSVFSIIFFPWTSNSSPTFGTWTEV